MSDKLKTEEEQSEDKNPNVEGEKKVNVPHHPHGVLDEQCKTDQKLPAESLPINPPAKVQQPSKSNNPIYQDQNSETKDSTKEPDIRQQKVRIYNSIVTEYLLREQKAIYQQNEQEKAKGLSNGKMNRQKIEARLKIFNEIRKSKLEEFVTQIMGWEKEIDLLQFFKKIEAIDALRKNEYSQPTKATIVEGKDYSYYNTISKQPEDFKKSQQECEERLNQLKAQIVPCLNPISQKYLDDNPDQDNSKRYNAHYDKHSIINLKQAMNNYSLFTNDDQINTASYNNEQIKKCIKTNDIIQGTFDDCYFLAAMASIVSRKPELIYRLFVRLKNPNHLYTIRLFIDGQWKPITVNLQFPVNKDLDFCCVRPNDQKIWVLLLEKAYAKLSGSYENINWGTEQQGVQILTGAPSFRYDYINKKFIDFLKKECSEGTAEDPPDPEQQKMLTPDQRAIKQQQRRMQDVKPACQVSIITTSIPYKEQLIKQLKELRLMSRHSYSVLGVFVLDTTGPQLDDQKEQIRLIKLRNPYAYRDKGNMIWNGAWSLKSKQWKDKYRKVVGYKMDPKDGTFFICEADFAKYFKFVNISHLNQNSVNSYLDLEDVIKNNFATVTIQIKQKGRYAFTLHLKDKRRLSKVEKESVYNNRYSWLFLLKKTEENLFQPVCCNSQKGQNTSLQHSSMLKVGQYKIVLKFNSKSTKPYHYCLSSYGVQQVKMQRHKTFQDSDIDDYFRPPVCTQWGQYKAYDYAAVQQEYKKDQEKAKKDKTQPTGGEPYRHPETIEQVLPDKEQQQPEIPFQSYEVGNSGNDPTQGEKSSIRLQQKHPMGPTTAQKDTNQVQKNLLSFEETEFFRINRKDYVFFEARFQKPKEKKQKFPTYKRVNIRPKLGFGIIQIRNEQHKTFHVKINFEQTASMMSILPPYNDKTSVQITVGFGETKSCKFITIPTFNAKLITYQYWYDEVEK